MTAVRRLMTILCAPLLAASALAQAPAPTQRTTEPVTAETDRDLSNPRALHLSLDDTIKTAMQQNLGVQLQRFDYAEAGQGLRSTYGIFDWLATSTFQQSSTQSPTISRFQPSATRSTVGNFGVSQLIPTGGIYSIDWTNSRVSTTGFGTIVSPAYRSGLGLSLTQPLMRNFGVDVTRRGITVARNTLGISRELFRTVLMDAASSVEQAYLDLIYARQYVDVVKEAVFLARDQARITQIRIDVGASAPLDILQPRVQIATTEEQLIAAVANVRDAEDRLRALMHFPSSDWDRPIIPTDSVRYTPMSVDVEQSVARAFDLRPEIRETRLTTDTRRIQALYARNQTRPKVDVSLGYSAAGLAGHAAAIDPFTGQPTGLISTGYSRALRQVFEDEFPSWSVGVNLGVPVLNIGARAEARRTRLEYERSRTDAEQTRQTIVVQVRAAARAIDTAAKEIVASRTGREAAEQNVDAERKRYENGMTTNFQVLQVQQQLADARAREIQALVGYNKAVAAYHRAIGDLLDVRNISVEEPEHVDEPQIFSSFARYNWLNYGNPSDLEKERK